jgi:hypothetical protein
MDTGLVRGLDIVGVRGLGDGEPLRFKFNNMLREGRLARRLDGEGSSVSSCTLGPRPNDKVRACFFNEVGVEGAVLADVGKATFGADREATARGLGSDKERSGCASFIARSCGALP